MAIDPSIPLGIRPAPIQSPLEALSTVTQFQAMRDQAEARRLAAEEARQKAKDAAAIRQILTETNGDIEAALPRLRTIAPKAALEFETEIANQRKATIDAHKSQLETSTKQLDLGVKLLQGVTDQATYDLVRPMIGTMAPDIAQAMGDTFDPARVQQFLQVGLSQKDIYDRKQDALKLFTEGKATEGLGQYFSTARTAEEWDGIAKSAVQLGVPRDLVTQFGTYSPENVQRAAQLALTPAKRAELAGQAETRAMTAAHNAATEATAAGQLAVSQGNLGVARGNLAVAQAREAREGAGGGVKFTGAQQEDMATMLTVEELARDLQVIDEKVGGFPGVGPVPGRLPASALGIGGKTGETVRNQLGNIQGTIAKIRGGTSFTPSEQRLLDSYTPTEKDTDAAIRTKLTNLVDFIQKKRANMIRVASGVYTLPAGGGGTTTTTTTTTGAANPFRQSRK